MIARVCLVILPIWTACAPFPEPEPLSGAPVGISFPGHEAVAFVYDTSTVQGDLAHAVVERVDDGTATFSRDWNGTVISSRDWSGPIPPRGFISYVDATDGVPVTVDIYGETRSCCHPTVISDSVRLSETPRPGLTHDRGDAVRFLDTVAGLIPDPNAQDVQAVAAFGNRMVLGVSADRCPSEDHTEIEGTDQFGRVFIFALENGVWVQEAQLFRPQPYNCDGFGSALAFDGDWLMVGSPPLDVFDGEANYPDFGFVYAYQFDGGQWTLQQTLQNFRAEADLTRSENRFGIELDMDSGVLVVRVHHIKTTQQSVWIDDEWVPDNYVEAEQYEIDYSQIADSWQLSRQPAPWWVGDDPVGGPTRYFHPKSIASQGWHFRSRSRTEVVMRELLPAMPMLPESQVIESPVPTPLHFGTGFAADDSQLAVAGQDEEGAVFVAFYELDGAGLSLVDLVELPHQPIVDEWAPLIRQLGLAFAGSRLVVGSYDSNLSLPFAVQPWEVTEEEATRWLPSGRATALLRPQASSWETEWIISDGPAPYGHPVLVQDKLVLVRLYDGKISQYPMAP